MGVAPIGADRGGSARVSQDSRWRGVLSIRSAAEIRVAEGGREAAGSRGGVAGRCLLMESSSGCRLTASAVTAGTELQFFQNYDQENPAEVVAIPGSNHVIILSDFLILASIHFAGNVEILKLA